MDTDRILAILCGHAPELQAAGLAHLSLFGSVARNEATPDSDIDLLADFDPDVRISLLTLSGLQIRLTDLLVPRWISSSASLKEPVRTRANREAVRVFRGPEMHFQDMLKAIALIEQFIGEMDFRAYATDIKTRAAVERELQILTEAAYRLKAEDEPLCPEPDWRKIRGMGNILRHAYDRVDDQAIWITVKEDLPQIAQAIRNALARHFPPENI